MQRPHQTAARTSTQNRATLHPPPPSCRSRVTLHPPPPSHSSKLLLCHLLTTAATLTSGISTQTASKPQAIITENTPRKRRAENTKHNRENRFTLLLLRSAPTLASPSTVLSPLHHGNKRTHCKEQYSVKTRTKEDGMQHSYR